MPEGIRRVICPIVELKLNIGVFGPIPRLLYSSESPLPHPSVSILMNNTMVASQISTNYLCSAVYSLLVYNPSRPCLTAECRFDLNQTRPLSLLLVYIP